MLTSCCQTFISPVLADDHHRHYYTIEIEGFIMSDFERLELASVETGTRIIVKAGEEPEAFTYTFDVREAGDRPYCELTQTNPDGTTVGPAMAILEGTGQWTTPEQNPVQRGDIMAGKPHQALALSIGWGALRLGGSVIISDREEPLDRYELRPECTAITLRQAE